MPHCCVPYCTAQVVQQYCREAGISPTQLADIAPPGREGHNIRRLATAVGAVQAALAHLDDDEGVTDWCDTADTVMAVCVVKWDGVLCCLRVEGYQLISERSNAPLSSMECLQYSIPAYAQRGPARMWTHVSKSMCGQRRRSLFFHLVTLVTLRLHWLH